MPQQGITINNKSLNPSTNNTGGVNWVSGIDGAKSWKMYPNTMDVLLDEFNDGIFYIKSTDNVGMTSAFRAFKYTEIPLDQVPNSMASSKPVNAVTREDFDAFKSEILEALKNNRGNGNYHYNKKREDQNNVGRNSESSN